MRFITSTILHKGSPVSRYIFAQCAIVAPSKRQGKNPEVLRPRGDRRGLPARAGRLKPEGGNLTGENILPVFNIIPVDETFLDHRISHLSADGSKLIERHAHREGFLDGGGVLGDKLAGGFGNHWCSGNINESDRPHGDCKFILNYLYERYLSLCLLGLCCKKAPRS